MSTSLRFAALAALATTTSIGCGGGSSAGAPQVDDTGIASGDAPVDAPSDAPSDAPTPTAGCTIARKGSAGYALQATILAPAGPIVGEVLVDAAGKIACVDKSCAATAGYDKATVISCPGSVLSPGLVNAHDHTDYDASPPIAHGVTRFDHRNDWRTGASALPKSNTTSDPKQLAAIELRFVMGGTTSINGSGGTPGLARNVASFKAPAWTEGLTGQTTFFDTFPLGDQKGTQLTTGCGYPKIRAASTAFASPAYTPHVAEGVNLAAENELTCLAPGSGNVLVTDKTGIIHAVGINAKDVDVIAKAKAKVIWSPRSNIDLYGNTAPVTELKTAGVTIALGTDWLPSGSMNELRELQCADSLNEKYFAKTFTDRELWEMATKNGAMAVGFASEIGAIVVGMQADLAMYDASSSKEYRAVIDAGVEQVQLVMRGGKLLYGDASILDATAAGCGALDVCGVAKVACVDGTGVSLADAQAGAASSYPLFFCKGTTPKNEPSCVPYRDTYKLGTSATDRDGDGIDDGADDCKEIFNPARPMDGTAQADVDSDGVGDACDTTPLASP